MKNVAIFHFALIGSLAALASLGAHAQPMGRVCSRLTTDLQDIAGLVDRTPINDLTENPVEVMKTALSASNRIFDGKPVPIVVELCNVEPIELTETIIIDKSDRALIAPPNCARGPRKLGPLIRVPTGRPGRGAEPLFQISGDNVIFSGFRLQGPNPEEIVRGDDHVEQGIRIFPSAELGPIRRIEICNMEIFHWSGAGIEVRDNQTPDSKRGRLLKTNEGAVRIRNNFIHNNRHGEGFGYGVNVAKGGYALIERNVFDENRHAIAGDSAADEPFDKDDFSGYTARENLILPGGGLHCTDQLSPVPGSFICWRTHQIDMHGNKSYWLYGEHCCGTAGETMLIERNTILYAPPPIDYKVMGVPTYWFVEWFIGKQGLAIKIRGNPADKAVADGNVFRHASWDDAKAQNPDIGKACLFFGHLCSDVPVKPAHPILGRNNHFGENPLTERESCDLVGDGLSDEFMATGVTWWAYSPWTRQWRYLNTMPEKFPQIQLVDVDNDGHCDVAERPLHPEMPFLRYSKSGTGPWRQWLGSDVGPG